MININYVFLGIFCSSSSKKPLLAFSGLTKELGQKVKKEPQIQINSIDKFVMLPRDDVPSSCREIFENLSG